VEINILGVTAIDITIHASFLPHNDANAALAFHRDTPRLRGPQ